MRLRRLTGRCSAVAKQSVDEGSGFAIGGCSGSGRQFGQYDLRNAAVSCSRAWCGRSLLFKQFKRGQEIGMFFQNGMRAVLQDDATLGKIDWNAIINQGFGLGSQAISAFSGRNSGTQIGYNSSQGVFAINPGGSGGGYRGYDEMATYAPGGGRMPVAAGGVGLDDAAGSVMGFVERNPLLVGAVAVGAYLLFREPPRRR